MRVFFSNHGSMLQVCFHFLVTIALNAMHRMRR
ncbi:hypothetical protein CsSME_00043079 [Camellia sinensis var. sinensis]